MYGGIDQDRFYGGAANDVMFGDSGNDTADGGADDDQIHGGVGDDLIGGGTSGDDRLWGDSGDDQLFGHSANNIILGGTGGDRLYGGSGNDTLFGDDAGTVAADRFVFDDDWGTDVVGDFQNGTDLFDLTAVAGLSSFAQLGIAFIGGSTYVSFAGDTFRIFAVNSAVIDATDFVL